MITRCDICDHEQSVEPRTSFGCLNCKQGYDADDCCMTIVLRPEQKALLKEQACAGIWDNDKPLPEDAAIMAAHPMSTGDHARYDVARRLVNAKYSKGALVELVNWLLSRIPEGM